MSEREWTRAKGDKDACESLKKKYEDCFNHWYAEDFLKGNLEPKCSDEFEAYRECVMRKMKEKNLGKVLEAAASSRSNQP